MPTHRHCRHTDIADPTYDNELTYDIPQLELIIDEILGTDRLYYFKDRIPGE